MFHRIYGTFMIGLVGVLWQQSKFKVLVNAVLLAKCLKAKLWENSKYISRQLNGIGPTLSNALVNAGLITFSKLEAKNPREIEIILNRHPPFGNQVIENVVKLPKYQVYIEQSTNYMANNAEMIITVQLSNSEDVQRNTNGTFNTCVLLVGNADDKVLLKTKINDINLVKNGTYTTRFNISRAQKGENIYVNLISQEWVGLDVENSFSPFYKRPRQFLHYTDIGSEISTRNSPERKKKCNSLSIERAQSESNEIPQEYPSSRKPCGHKCRDKNSCAHDCCKHGVAIKQKKPSAIELMQNDLQQKLETLPSTPTMRKSKIHSLKDLKSYAFEKKMEEKIAKVPPTPAQGWEHMDVFMTKNKGVEHWILPESDHEIEDELSEMESPVPQIQRSFPRANLIPDRACGECSTSLYDSDDDFLPDIAEPQRFSSNTEYADRNDKFINKMDSIEKRNEKMKNKSCSKSFGVENGFQCKHNDLGSFDLDVEDDLFEDSDDSELLHSEDMLLENMDQKPFIADTAMESEVLRPKGTLTQYDKQSVDYENFHSSPSVDGKSSPVDPFSNPRSSVHPCTDVSPLLTLSWQKERLSCNPTMSKRNEMAKSQMIRPNETLDHHKKQAVKHASFYSNNSIRSPSYDERAKSSVLPCKDLSPLLAISPPLDKRQCVQSTRDKENKFSIIDSNDQSRNSFKRNSNFFGQELGNENPQKIHDNIFDGIF